VRVDGWRGRLTRRMEHFLELSKEGDGWRVQRPRAKALGPSCTLPDFGIPNGRATALNTTTSSLRIVNLQSSEFLTSAVSTKSLLHALDPSGMHH
jgi:hypothetical protein